MQTAQRDSRRIGATPRALLIGALATVFVNVASPYTESTGFSNFSWSYLPEGAAFPFLLLLAVNAVGHKLCGRPVLTTPELVLAFSMALAANCTSIFLMYFLCSAIVSPHYFSSPENRWDQELIPYLKPWLIVSDDRHAARWFYEGLPPGQRIPWADWLIPLGAWMPLLIALLVASFTMVALMRRQWLHHEKLAYPLMRIPLELMGLGPVARDRGGHLWNRTFWIGALTPLAFAAADLLNRAFPGVPALVMDHLGSLHFGVLRPGPHFPHLVLNLNFLALSSAYFVPADVLLGVWLLYLGIKLGQEPVVNRLGLGAGSAGMFVWGQASTAWQSFGAFTVMVLSVVTSARRHLCRMCAQGLAGTSEEATSVKVTLLGLAASLLLMLGWLVHSGMPPAVAALFVPLVMAIYLGLARIVCQSGIFYVVPAMIAQNPIIYALGPDAIGRRGMVSLGLSYAWHGDVQTVLAVLAAQAMKLEDQARLGRGELSMAMLASAVIGLIVAPLGIILTAYPRGALSWTTWVYRGWGPNTYGQILGQLGAGRPRDWFNAGYYALGIAGMVCLTALRNRFAWWPLHPIGLAAVSSFTMYAVYLPFLVAWIVKLAILRWGGARAYHAATPFFIGLGVGHYLARGLSLVGYTAMGVPWRL